MANGGPSKRTVIDALVLAFSHSKAKEVVGTDALRSVLDVEYSELTSSGAFALQGVWELLLHQPEFEQSTAIPPLCLFKSWEHQLGIEVRLPDALSHFDAAECRRQAAECRVPIAEIKAVIGTGTPAAAPAPAAAARDRAPDHKRRAKRTTLSPKVSAKAKKPPMRPARRRAILAAAGLVAALSFGFVGVTAYRGCSPEADWQSLEVTAFAGELPIRDARKLGKRVGAKLADLSWLDGPKDVREEQLARAFKILERRKIVVLFLTDDRDRIVASIQRDGAGKLTYSFR